MHIIYICYYKSILNNINFLIKNYRTRSISLPSCVAFDRFLCLSKYKSLQVQNNNAWDVGIEGWKNIGSEARETWAVLRQL